MAITEYKLIQIPNGPRVIPDYIKAGGYWLSPFDSTLIGWYDDTPGEFAIDGQSTIVEMTKSQFIARQLAIHAVYPMIKPNEDREAEPVPMTDAEVEQFTSDWFDSFFTENLIVTTDPEKIVELQSKKINQAFLLMEKNLENASVDVMISSESATCPFGCDRITQENIIGINTAISRGIAIPNPTYWTPKGYPYPVTVTHSELAEIGGSILNKKNELYQIYFIHKSNIMMTSDYSEIAKYDFATGY